jgi:dTDP-D-glucose 4,6-dehydratase
MQVKGIVLAGGLGWSRDRFHDAELGWRPSRPFEAALRDTVRWYLDHQDWWRPIRSQARDGAPARTS